MTLVCVEPTLKYHPGMFESPNPGPLSGSGTMYGG